jgi:hypothetical protein
MYSKACAASSSEDQMKMNVAEIVKREVLYQTKKVLGRLMGIP